MLLGLYSGIGMQIKLSNADLIDAVRTAPPRDFSTVMELQLADRLEASDAEILRLKNLILWCWNSTSIDKHILNTWTVVGNMAQYRAILDVVAELEEEKHGS